MLKILLNADKTEILKLESNVEKVFDLNVIEWAPTFQLR